MRSPVFTYIDMLAPSYFGKVRLTQSTPFVWLRHLQDAPSSVDDPISRPPMGLPASLGVI